ncbi:MAG: hypothetical protein K8L99_25625 [Anaerolineae bacterium]|nr:hypothetical protein [Anaerolineae bacterium]
MVVTQLEGKVSSDQWDTLKQTFTSASQQLPSAIDHSYLIQDQATQDMWRILTIWKSREALQDYRASIETPGGVLIFREAGAEPTLSIYDVIDDTYHE